MCSRPVHLMSYLLTASLLLAGFVASTHVHPPAGSQPVETTLCSCQSHQPTPVDAPPAGPEEDHCFVCKLLAQFHADGQQPFVLVVAHQSASHVFQQPAEFSSWPIRLFQGRAPPTV